MKSIHCVVLTILATTAGEAAVIESSPSHYVLRHEGYSTLPPAALWARLVEPSSWWAPRHSYSGDAANLSLEPRAGGLWKEEWAAGSVAHGTVLYAESGRQLRLNAPFGPLQAMAVQVIWTITISSDGDGSKVVFDEVANGSTASQLNALAPAVDGVKAQAMQRLTEYDIERSP